MSRTLSTNAGSPESLQVREQCGCSPKAFRMRRTVVCERPLSRAIGRVDQWMASGGVVWSVRPMTYATRSSPTVRGRPDRGPSDSPSRRSSEKRRRHLPTVRRLAPNSAAATSLFGTPSAQRRIMRQRSDREQKRPNRRPFLRDT